MATLPKLRISELPMSVEQHPEEPAHSLLLRALAANGVPTAVRFIAGVCGSRSLAPTRIDVDAVATLTRAVPEALRRSTPVYSEGAVVMYGVRIPRSAWAPRIRRFCPLCLAEHPADRSWWEVACVQACPRHRVALRDRCDCGRMRDWSVACAHACRCENLYRNCAADPSPHGCAVEQWMLERLLSGGGGNGPGLLDGADVAQAIDAMTHLGALSLGQKVAPRDLVRSLGPSRVLAAGFELLSDFPARLEEALERTLQVPADNGKSMDGIYGSSLMSWIERKRRSPLVSKVAGVVSRHAAATVRGRPDLNVISTKAARRKLVPVPKLARECGTDYSRLRDLLIGRGLIRAKPARGVPNGLTPLQAAEIRADVANHIGSAAAARSMGLTHAEFIGLLNRGRILPVSGKDDMMYAGDVAILKAEDVKALRARLFEAAEAGEHEIAVPIFLATRILGLREAEVLDRLASGELRSGGRHPWSDPYLVQTVIVPKPAWMSDDGGTRPHPRAGTTPADWISATKGARLMGVDPSHVFDLIRAGLLPGFKASQSWRIPPEFVESFIERNVPLVHLASRSGLSPTEALETLSKASVAAVLSPPTVRTTWFPRAEAERALGLPNGG